MGGKRSRDKGNRREREIVAKLEETPGISANRVPLSGAAGGEYSGDIKLFSYPMGINYRAEVKARATASGWQTIKKWLGSNDLLFLVEDRQEPLVVMPWSLFWAFMDRLAALDTFHDGA